MRATRDTLIGEVVRVFPKAAFVMQQYGFHCAGCFVSQYETFAQGAKTHGMTDEQLDEMIDDLNLFLAEEERRAAEHTAATPAPPQKTTEQKPTEQKRL